MTPFPEGYSNSVDIVLPAGNIPVKVTISDRIGGKTEFSLHILSQAQPTYGSVNFINSTIYVVYELMIV